MRAAWEMFRYFGWPYFVLICILLALILFLVAIWDKI